MANIRTPRSGSMQFWPRVRSKREYARLRVPAVPKDAKSGVFAGYKVGMTHIIITDNRKGSPTKGAELSWPVTVIECPPIKVIGARLYKRAYVGKQVTADIYETKHDKDVQRKAFIPKKQEKALDQVKTEDFEDLRLIVITQPRKTGLGKKTPEIFEITVGGNKDQKLQYAKDNLGKEIKATDVFKEGEQLNIHSITKGKGYQGPVKRFGVDIRRHKSEKTKRGPGSLGGWRGQGHVMYRVAHAGKMGYHQRTEYNKQVLKISDKPEEINVKGGFKNYGLVKTTYMLIKGGVGGPSKRMILFSEAKRPRKNVPKEAPAIEAISLESHQGR